MFHHDADKYVQLPGGKKAIRGTADKFNYKLEPRVINNETVMVKVYETYDDSICIGNKTLDHIATYKNTNNIDLTDLEDTNAWEEN